MSCSLLIWHVSWSLNSDLPKKRINELANKRQEKVAIDCNVVFADITTIKAAQDQEDRLKDAWEQQDRAAEARRTANSILAHEIVSWVNMVFLLPRPDSA
jgi:hypothetical protein